MQMKTDSSTSEDAEFAYGACRISGCGCPAVQAGFETMETKPWMLNAERHKFLGIYDQKARELTDNQEGIIAEDIARQAWQDAMEHIRETNMSQQEKMLSFARQVQAKFGWDSNQPAQNEVADQQRAKR